MKVIILDDEILVAEVLEQMCKRLGVDTVISFTDPHTAINNIAEFEDTDLAFIDRYMPGFRGDDFLPALDKMGTKVVIITGALYDDSITYPECVLKVLRKPFSKAQIMECLDSVRDI